jgi:DNA-binding response OmpR family regulator
MKTLLVLGTEPLLVKLAHYALAQHNLIEATTAEQALRTFIDHDHHIDCLIADVTLPISSGLQVALLLRSKIPDLPVILTFGQPVSSWSVRDAADLERLGSNSVTMLQKPFHVLAFLNAVYSLIGTPEPVERVRTA